MQSFRIGRGPQNSIVINDPYISDSHCQITLDDKGRFYITDLGNTSGTYVNENIIEGSVWLNPGDTVRIGNTTLPWMDYFSPAAAQYQRPNQYANPQPNYPVREPNGMGTAGFVLSLLTLVLCWVPFINLILFILGLTFSIIGVTRKNSPKGLAIAGLVLSCIYAFLMVVGIVVLINGGVPTPYYYYHY